MPRVNRNVVEKIWLLSLLVMVSACGLSYRCEDEPLAKNYGQAIIQCTEAIHSGLLFGYSLAAAYTTRGILYSKQHEYVYAILDYNQAIQTYRDFPEAFNSRGVTYYKNQEYSRAMADYNTEALRLDPSFAPAYANRGVVYSDNKEFDLAVEEFSRALREDPNLTGAYRGRGYTRFHLDQFSQAAQDFSKALEHDPTDLSGHIWLYVANVRSGKDARAQLEQRTKHLDLSEWPGPVVGMYLGKLNGEELILAAAHHDARKHREQLCEGYFYSGMQALLAGRKEEAIQLFRASVATDVSEFVEYQVALTELKRLGL